MNMNDFRPEFRPTGTTRDSSVYVSWQTRKGLGYVPKEDDETIDSLAEKILADWLKANHPNIVEHMKSQYEADKAFRELLGEKAAGGRTSG